MTEETGSIDPFLGDEQMELQEIFVEERFPNVVVALGGTVVATWGAKQLVVRRSEDGGVTWGPTIDVGKGIHAGGSTVDEETGDLLVFGHPEHPAKDSSMAPRTIYRSTDAGRTWQGEEPVFDADERGHVPSLHFSEAGITLRQGSPAGRLLRPARVYVEGAGYNMAVFSDDHGKTWQASTPFPVDGTGEGCVTELDDGRIYYSSRQHRFAEGETLRHERLYAWSHDGGATWPVKRLVDEGPSAYSSLAAGRGGTPSEGWVYLQYEERSGGGRVARFNLSWVLAGELTGDGDLPEKIE